MSRPDATGPPPPPPPPAEAAWAHRDDLIAYARRMLGAQADLAEDVVQEAYLRLHEEALAGRVAEAERPWLFRVTRNLALDERRRARSREGVRSALASAPAQSPGPLERLQLAEAARATLEEIDHLPPAERRALLLDQAGMAPTAIARLMGTTTNAVHQSLFRARRRLRAVRSAAWALLPIPLARGMLRTSDPAVLSRIPRGSGDGVAGGAALAAVALATLGGGGALVTLQPAPGSVDHVRAERQPAPARLAPAPAAAAAAPAPPAPAAPAPAARPVSAPPDAEAAAPAAAPRAPRPRAAPPPDPPAATVPAPRQAPRRPAAAAPVALPAGEGDDDDHDEVEVDDEREGAGEDAGDDERDDDDDDAPAVAPPQGREGAPDDEPEPHDDEEG